MKRYQCIKNCRVEMFTFRPGHIYDFEINSSCTLHGSPCLFYGYKTVGGRIIWLNPDQISGCFQELLDLNVDEPNASYNDHDAAEYDRFLSGLPTTRGCAIAVAISIALIAIIILTWNS